MKTYEEILKEVRKEFEMLDSWNVGSDTTDDKFRERVAKKYAFEVAQKALEDAAERAMLGITFSHPNIENKKSSQWRDVMGELYEIDKQSILSTPLIIE